MQQFAPQQGFAPPPGFMPPPGFFPQNVPQNFPPPGFPPQGFMPQQGFMPPPGFMPPSGFQPQTFPPTQGMPVLPSAQPSQTFPPTQGTPVFSQIPPMQAFPPAQNVSPTQIIPLMPASNLPTTQATAPNTCIYGLVNLLIQPGLVGATNGTITPFLSSPIPITQVVGPAGGMIPLTAVNGQFALLCGRLQPGNSGCQLNVSQVVPFGLPGTLTRAEFGGNIGPSQAALQTATQAPTQTATQPATLPSAQTGGM